MNIYQEHILDHYQNPRNWGQIKDANLVLEGANMSCGDEIKFFLKVDNSRIQQLSFISQACAICTASASILTEQLRNKKLDDIHKITTDNILANLGIPLSPTRLKCALLPLETLQKLKNLETRKKHHPSK